MRLKLDLKLLIIHTNGKAHRPMNQKNLNYEIETILNRPCDTNVLKIVHYESKESQL